VSQNVLGRRRTEAPLRRARRLGEAIGATAVVGGGHPSYPSRPGESEATETVDPGSSQDVPSPPTTTTSFFDPYTSLISYATSEIQKFGSKLHFVLNQNKVQFFQKNVPFRTENFSIFRGDTLDPSHTNNRQPCAEAHAPPFITPV